MRKGLNYWSFPDGTNAEDAIDAAVQAGFHGLEFALAQTGPVALDTSEAQLRAIRGRAESQGLALPSLASWLPWENNLVSDDPEERSRARDIVRTQIDAAHILGCETILVVPGYVGVDFVPDSTPVDYEWAYERGIEAMGELGPYARSAGIDIGVENVWNKFLLSPLEMRGFVDAVDDPAVGVYFDIGNALLYGYPEQWIRILGERIRKVHVKDYRRSPGGFDSFVDLLAGDVDFPAVTAALELIGYDSFITAEIMPPYQHFPNQLIVNTSASMDQIFAWSEKETGQ